MKNKKGFTLIELLAVIIILGVLLLVAVPGITSLINQSKRKTFISTAQLAIENIEQSSSIEYSIDGSITKCFIPLSDINLTRGSFGTNAYGYVLVDTDGKASITYSNGTYSVDGKKLDEVSDGTTKTSSNVSNAPSDSTIGKCSWYEG